MTCDQKSLKLHTLTKLQMQGKKELLMFITKKVDDGAAEDRGYKCKDWHSVAP